MSVKKRFGDAELIEEPGDVVLTVEVFTDNERELRVDITSVSVTVTHMKMPKKFWLPTAVLPEQARARLHKGILEVVVPKRLRDGNTGHKQMTGDEEPVLTRLTEEDLLKLLDPPGE